MTHPLSELARFAQSLADAARPIALRYFRQPLDVDHKSVDQPVTIADREIEATLRRLIQSAFPEHGIFGEEYGSEGVHQRHVWVIDPIDGTKSFITGMPLFGTLIALLEDGQPILGIIDMPVLGERWIGMKGASTTFNGKEVRVRACEDVKQATFCSTFPTSPDSADGRAYARLSSLAQLVRFGGDCYIYGLLASGFVDMVVETGLQPYDYLAMVPVIEGAGGRISDWQGLPLTLRSDGRVLATASAKLHQQALETLTK